MCLWLKSLTAQDCSIIIVRMKPVQSSGQPCHLLAGLFQSTHNTKDHLDSTTFFKTTLYTEHFFQNLYSRQAALTNRSRTSITHVNYESGRNPRNTSTTYRTEQMDPRESYGETLRQLSSQTCTTPSNSSTPTSSQLTLSTFHPTQWILVVVPCCMSLRTMRP